MKFSVIIPSYLGDYRSAAKDRDKKIVRAVHSVLNQTFKDFEVIIVADGCDKTVELYFEHFEKYDNIDCWHIQKCKIWTGGPRDTGIDKANGDYIVYLDVDDLMGKNHLQNLSDGLKEFDWVWFDDIRFSPKKKVWFQNPCDIRILGKHGTSNICHKRSLPYRWDHKGYAHDYYFIKNLKRNTNHTKINGGEYYVCHIPGSNEGKGYDC